VLVLNEELPMWIRYYVFSLLNDNGDEVMVREAMSIIYSTLPAGYILDCTVPDTRSRGRRIA
jgi:hypothetical protein